MSVCCPKALAVWLRDVGGLSNCLRSRKFLEHLCRALGAAFGKADGLFSAAVVRYVSEDGPPSTAAASWPAAVLLDGCSFVGFWRNSDEF